MSFVTTRAMVVLFALAAAPGCTRSDPPRPAPQPTAVGAPASSDHAVLRAGETVTGASIYDLEATLADQDGERSGLAVHRGHPVIVSMFYSSCPQACPTLISNVKRIEAALDAPTRADLRVLLVSIDPEHDTPAALRAVAARHQLDTSRWKLTTTTESQVREIAAVLGVVYRQADGSFNHSSVITLLDREGRIDTRSDGLADATAHVAGRISELRAATR